MKDTELEKLVETEGQLLKSFAGKTFLVTGATGLIGSAVCRVLLESNRRYGTGIKVIAAFRNRSKFESVFGSDADKMTVLESDIAALADVFDDSEKPDYILHCASQTDSKSFLKNPLETINTALSGVRSVIEIGRHFPDCSILNFSTQEVYGDAPEGRDLASNPWKESELGFLDLYNPRNSYPVVKRCCENICCCFGAEYGISTSSLRLAQTFGPGVSLEDKRVFAMMARCAINREDIVLNTPGSSKHAYLYSAQAVTAILTVLLRGSAGKAYNAANPNTYCSIYEMGRMVASQIADGQIAVRVNSSQDTSMYPPTSYLNLDITEITKLGWKPEADLKYMFDRMMAAMV